MPVQHAGNRSHDEFSVFFMTLKLETDTLPADKPVQPEPTVVGFERPTRRSRSRSSPSMPLAVDSPVASPVSVIVSSRMPLSLASLHWKGHGNESKPIESSCLHEPTATGPGLSGRKDIDDDPPARHPTDHAPPVCRDPGFETDRIGRAAPPRSGSAMAHVFLGTSATRRIEADRASSW